MFLPGWFDDKQLLPGLPKVGDRVMESHIRRWFVIEKRMKNARGVFFRRGDEWISACVVEWWPSEGDLCSVHGQRYADWLHQIEGRRKERSALLGDSFVNGEKVLFVRDEIGLAVVKGKTSGRIEIIPTDFLIVEVEQGVKVNANTKRIAA